MKLSRNPPSVVPVISPVLTLELSPEAFPLVGLLGVPVPVCTDYRWVMFSPASYYYNIPFDHTISDHDR